MKEKLSAAGAVLAAVLASICCWGPLLLAGLGAGGAGVASAFAPYRPYFMAVTFAFLAGAWYIMLRQRPAAMGGQQGGAGATCRAQEAREACCAPNRNHRRNMLLLSAVTAFAVGILFFPYFSLVLAESRRPALQSSNSVAARDAEQWTALLGIEGMT